jgi:4-diphosphocytidyl-2-C-methyl-D-erythritol kinase
VTIHVPAKINLSLNVLAHARGLHVLDSVMCSIDLYDSLTLLARSDSNVVVRFVGDGVDVSCLDNQRNSAYAMARALQAAYDLPGMDIEIVKRIPIMAGLGGSSADAAGVYNALVQLHCLSLTDADKAILARSIGDDVLYMMHSYCARVQEGCIHSIDSRCQLNLVLLQCGGGISTARCFYEFGKLHPTRVYAPCDNDALIVSMQSGVIVHNVDNALTRTAIGINPHIERALMLLRQSGARVASMTGTGAACFGIYDDNVDTLSVAQALRSQCDWAIAAKSICT